MRPNQIVLSVLVSLGIGNALLANCWYHVLDPRIERFYAVRRVPGRKDLVVRLTAFSALSAGVFAIITLGVESAPGLIANLVLLALLQLQVLVLWRTAHDHFRSLRRAARAIRRSVRSKSLAFGVLAALMLFAAIAATVVALDAIRFLVIAAGVLGLVSLPWGAARACAYLVAGHAANRHDPIDPLVEHDPAAENQGLARVVSSAWDLAVREGDDAKRKRVILLVFDEFDFGTTFQHRPKGLALPNIDALRSESLYFESAFPVAHCTELSMPALIAGMPVRGTWPLNRSDLRVRLAVAEAEHLVDRRWSELPSMFADANAAGLTSALVGWYHPYGRVLSPPPDYCEWYDDRHPAFAVRDSIVGGTIDVLRSLVETGRYSPFGQSLATAKAIAQHEAIRDAAERIVLDERADLIFLHWPVPHSPHFFDPSTGNNTARNRGDAGYLDSLRLVDSIVGTALSWIATSAREHETRLIVTSDHWWRLSHRLGWKRDVRVPLMIRDSDQRVRGDWHQGFSCAHLRELIRRSLAGRLTSQSALEDWLSANAEHDVAERARLESAPF